MIFLCLIKNKENPSSRYVIIYTLPTLTAIYVELKKELVITAKLHNVMTRDVTISHRIILKVTYQAEVQAKNLWFQGAYCVTVDEN
jgi:hypothetical protein